MQVTKLFPGHVTRKRHHLSSVQDILYTVGKLTIEAFQRKLNSGITPSIDRDMGKIVLDHRFWKQFCHLLYYIFSAPPGDGA